MVADVLDNEEGIIDKIITKSSMPREELEDKIIKKKEEYGGLLTTAGAAYSIAKDLGIDLELEGDVVRITQIKELDADLGRASVRGVVTHVFPVKNWEKNGKGGTVASVTLKDSTGETRLTFWNDDCQKLEKLMVGSQIEVQNALTRKRGEIVELSYGRASQLLLKESPDSPQFEEKLIKLDELEEGMENVNCYAKIVRIFPAKNFERKDGKRGSVANLVINDGTETRLALWDQNSAWTNKLDPGDTLKIEYAYVRENNGSLELNLGWKGRLIKNPKSAPELPDIKVEKSARKNITELKEGDNYKEIRAVVVQAYQPIVFSFCPKCMKKTEGTCQECKVEAKQTLIFNSELDDGTGVIRGVFFRDMAEQFLGITAKEFQEGGYDINKILGIEKIFQGQTKLNQRFERDEFIVRRIKDIDLDYEIKVLEGV